MASLVRLCLLLRALAWVAQAQECPGDGSDMVSRIKFKWYPDSKIFAQPGDGEIDFLNNVPSLQDCANRCAVNEKCQASVWDETSHDCRLISDTDGCQDGEPSHHSLWRVGFIDDTDINTGCSQGEIDAKCADKEKAGRLEAEKECNIRNNDLRAEIARLQAENAALRAAKSQAERRLADTITDGIEAQKSLNRQCQDKLNEEIERRRKAVKDAREDAERNCRSKQDNDLQKRLDELRTECDGRMKVEKAEREHIESQCAENRKRCADDYNKLTQKCGDDLSKANQQQKDSENKCNEAIRQKEDLIQQCTDNLSTVKGQQKHSENQCQEEKANLQKECDNSRNTDKTLLEARCEAEKDTINKQCSYDLNSAKNQQKQSENQCQEEKANLQKECDNSRNTDKTLLEARCEAEKDTINKQCSYDLNSAKNQQKQSESKCQAEKDAINKQCTNDLDAARSQLQQELKSECQMEKDELETQFNDRLAKEQKTSDDKCQREKDELRKECEVQCAHQKRGKDDICYNPGFGAWPETIPPFDVDDTKYVLKPNTNIWEGFSQAHTATSPASCARDYCNNVNNCYAILWELNKSNNCRVFIDSEYSPFDKSRLQKFNNGYMIIKSDRMR
ncbi:hypothetical protein FACUT_10963 [Fusarium acutatum]|uniref:Apple domain-containing protein n=1 Tax=Fusarium acutatum TaxID=78861 RepID=A0A8H4JE15_9HYPO|nr:hypothetical protein FACUT_10963 [Fusarium acutatum]